jgi:hypothetical protein
VPLVCNCNGFEARVSAKCAEYAPDVVPHRLGAEVQLGGDLVGRVPALEEPQDLGLARRQARMWRQRNLILLDLFHLPEDADNLVSARERHATHLHRESLSIRPQEDAAVIRPFRWPHEVAEEEFTTATSFLRCQDGGHLASNRVTYEPLRGGIQPPDDPLSVDHIGRDPNALKGAFHVAADLP